MMNKVQRGLLAAVIALTTTAATDTEGAQSCVTEHGLQDKLGSGSAKIFVNGVFFRAEQGPSSGGGTFTDWLVQGQNKIRIEYDGDDAQFSITQGCRDEMPDDEYVDQAIFDAPGTKTLSFIHDRPVEDEYLSAEIAGEEGLAEAIESFHKAAVARDIDAIFALQAPLFRDAKRRGYPVDIARAFAREVVTKGATKIAESYTITPVLGGRVYQVLDANMEPPIRVVYKDENGSYEWSSGSYWGRFDGKWGIIA
ncbi:hypothetical protein [Sphingorhabdus sp. M41]|uniref:hypothetical protein n=1 Tax=Sphingorhabdus sp. M41 TaxID=1806885 RepID=UPI00078EA737|nr:hypothetical protein [Sphingorhabdus sp. M41]AMO72688.1 hypothetical protein AZE99_13255 [Sphingorhabdus sp. M41]